VAQVVLAAVVIAGREDVKGFWDCSLVSTSKPTMHPIPVVFFFFSLSQKLRFHR
jgi:hypothetical protein